MQEAIPVPSREAKQHLVWPHPTLLLGIYLRGGNNLSLQRPRCKCSWVPSSQELNPKIPLTNNHTSVSPHSPAAASDLCVEGCSQYWKKVVLRSQSISALSRSKRHLLCVHTQGKPLPSVQTLKQDYIRAHASCSWCHSPVSLGGLQQEDTSSRPVWTT